MEAVSIPAVRSALKVVYTPGITIDSPIGLRNDPLTATILQRGREWSKELWEARYQRTPSEMREYAQWLEDADGLAFTEWSKRAFALAGAYEVIASAWEREVLTEEEDRARAQLQAMADRAQRIQTNQHWLWIFACLLVFCGFFFVGPTTSAALVGLRIVLYGAAGLLLVGYGLARWYVGHLDRKAQKQGVTLAQIRHQQVTKPQLWVGEGLSHQRILNFANWALMSTPPKNSFIPLDPPVPQEYEGPEAEKLDEWHTQVLDLAHRWYREWRAKYDQKGEGIR
ncbi:hypothetical protein [Gleimia hominis]|uniref:hypothetical protein n=1 Tax=Gleimia hominis TaxID=595468 RepID=UPI000C80EDC0|nr:hypothetical protein [Gleimia hominis]WIK64894.1 hypothetical protein CJ187_002210 [Gleimia hominis]